MGENSLNELLGYCYISGFCAVLGSFALFYFVGESKLKENVRLAAVYPFFGGILPSSSKLGANAFDFRTTTVYLPFYGDRKPGIVSFTCFDGPASTL